MNPTSNLPLFAPNIQTPAPSVPTKSSEDAADAITRGPFRAKSYRVIIAALAAAGRGMTREELSAATGYKESTLCGRISELSGLWIEVLPSHTRARSGFLVDAYTLTPACRELMAAEWNR